MPFGPTTLMQQDDVMSKDRMNTYVFQPLADIINPPFASYNKPISDPNITTASTTFVDLDATNFNLSLVTKGNPVMLTFRGVANHATLAALIAFEITINGSVYGGGANGVMGVIQSAANSHMNVSFTEIIPLVAGTYAFKIQWKTSTGTGIFVASYFPQFTVREI